jgi:hypothetical protein
VLNTSENLRELFKSAADLSALTCRILQQEERPAKGMASIEDPAYRGRDTLGSILLTFSGAAHVDHQAVSMHEGTPDQLFFQRGDRPLVEDRIRRSEID